MKRILSIDGGGALGIIPLTVLKIIEKKLNKPICEIFDLIIGTSVGAIIGGVLSTGKLSAEEFHKQMLKDLPNIFKKRLRIPVLQPKYDRKKIDESIVAKIGEMYMTSCVTKFMCTSINYVDGIPHFFKSWEEKDGKLRLTEALLRSSAAPLYFGKIVDKDAKAVWTDGGCGGLNNPSMQGYIEALRQKWLPNEEVHLMSIGCGETFKGIPFDKSKGFNNVQEVAYYIDIESGGLARAQMSLVLDSWLSSLSKDISNFSAQRIQSYNFPERISKLDNVASLSEFVSFGEKMAEQVNYSYFNV
jgi:uncharacterized protein